MQPASQRALVEASLPTVLIAATNFVVPQGMTMMHYRLQGGGGGGGGGSTALSSGGITNQPGGGGGSPGVEVEGWIPVTPGETLSYVHGTGGAGGVGGAVNGGTAGNGSSGGTGQIKRGSTVLATAVGGARGNASTANNVATTAGGAYGNIGVSTTSPQPAGNGGHATTSGGQPPGGPVTTTGGVGGTGGGVATGTLGGVGGNAAQADAANVGIPAATSGNSATVNGMDGQSALGSGCGGAGGGGGAPTGTGGAGGRGGPGRCIVYFTVDTSTAYIPNTTNLQRQGQLFTTQTPALPRSLRFDPYGQPRFELQAGDVIGGAETDRERCELQGNSKWPFATDIWLSIPFFIENGPTISSTEVAWCVIGQMHQTEDASEGGLSPVFSQNFINEHLQVFALGNSTGTSADFSANGVSTTVYDAALSRGVWHYTVYRLRFGQGSGGQMDMYLDGTSVYSNNAVPMGFNDAVGPYLKYGVYRQLNTPTNTKGIAIKYGQVEISLSSLFSRVASPLPVY